MTTTKEKKLISSRAWKARNKERTRIKRAEYYARNKEKERANNLAWLAENAAEWKIKKAAIDKLYREENKEEIKLYRSTDTYKYNKNERARNRYATDENYRYEKLLRASVTQAIRIYKQGQGSVLSELIGCSMDDFMLHIQSQFKEGMTWESDFHIDHIKPCSAFDLTMRSEQIECFHFSNMQHLWPHENYEKGSRIQVKVGETP